MAKKVSKPVFVVDVVDVVKPETWVHRINQAKIEAGLPISKRDYDEAVQECGKEGYHNGYTDGFDDCETVMYFNSIKTENTKKKDGVVKRFWNWLTNKK